MNTEDQKRINRTIKNWALKSIQAEDNPRLLLESDSNTEYCVVVMKELSKCEADLFQLKDTYDIKELPIELQNYFSNSEKENYGCPPCWVSSAGPIHSECDFKIKRFFDSVEKLKEYGTKLIYEC